MKLDNKPYYTFAIVGDGECDEGSIWEMALFANQFKLNQLVVVVDHNKMQSMDFCEKTISKDKILEMYLNNVYLGAGAYGVSGAALRPGGSAHEEPHRED